MKSFTTKRALNNNLWQQFKSYYYIYSFYLENIKYWGKILEPLFTQHVNYTTHLPSQVLEKCA